jgi:hypothetical protein
MRVFDQAEIWPVLSGMEHAPQDRKLSKMLSGMKDSKLRLSISPASVRRKL